ncbi:hypothetical protein HF1_13880 [Mycoplasma haemofelis str. Langford 1]|uniref:Uncharacterized protein n=1 Tax=Mycoplasma haemofelis (strain Langford 1) TaxID=941640 RepID=E8ZJS5_MYCHL|nr:hypothetical protein [Mycoplasma haemofelis]CBY93396.1 hypothetical protein HF1_13880 [Mycoplasma haemofelis str. Langford 1]
MNMNLAYAGLATGVAGASGVSAYYGVKSFNTVRIRDQLKGRILPSNDSTKWSERLNDVKVLGESDSLSPELSSFKSSISSKSWEDMRNLCSDLAYQEFKSKNNKVFSEVVTYCTYKNKDKLGSGIITESTIETKWKAVNEKLKNATGTLSAQMTTIKGQINTNTNSATQLKEWCNGVYNKPFLNEPDTEFEDAKVYCVS